MYVQDSTSPSQQYSSDPNPSEGTTGYAAIAWVRTRISMVTLTAPNAPIAGSIPIVTVNGHTYTDISYYAALQEMGSVHILNLYPNKEYTITIDFAGYTLVTIQRNIPAASTQHTFYPTIRSLTPYSHTSMRIVYWPTNRALYHPNMKLKVYAYSTGNIAPAAIQEFEPAVTQVFDPNTSQTYYVQYFNKTITGLVNVHEYKFRAAFIRDGIETEMSPLSGPAYLLIEPDTNPVSYTTIVTPSQVQITLAGNAQIETIRPAVFDTIYEHTAFTGPPNLSDYSLSSNSNVATITKYNGALLQQGSSYLFVITGSGYTNTLVNVTIPIPSILSTPAGFAVSAGIRSLTVDWAPVTYADNYDVKVNGTVTNYLSSGLSTVGGKYQIILSDLTNETSYEISVRAASSDPLYTQSSYTTPVSATSTVAIGVVSFQVVTGDDRFTVSDMTADGAALYDISYKNAEGTVLESLSVTGTQIISASNFNKYEVRVRGRNDAGVGAYSELKYVTPFGSFSPSGIVAEQIAQLGSAELAIIGSATIAELPPTVVAEAASVNSTFAAAIQTFISTQVTTLLSDESINDSPSSIKTKIDAFLHQQAAIAVAKDTDLVPTPINIADPERLGTTLNTLSATSALTVVPIPMAANIDGTGAPLVTVIVPEGENNTFYLAGQAGDCVRLQSATDSTKSMTVAFNSAGELVIDGIVVSGNSQIISSPFGPAIQLIHGSAVIAGLSHMDIVRTNTDTGVQLNVLFNDSNINYSAIGSIKIQTLSLPIGGNTFTDVNTITVPISSGASSVVTTIDGLESNKHYKFVAWLEDAIGNQGPKSSTHISQWVQTADTALLDVFKVTCTGNALTLFARSKDVATLSNNDIVININTLATGTRIATPHYDNMALPKYGSASYDITLPDYFNINYNGLIAGTLYDLQFTHNSVVYNVRGITTGTPQVVVVDSTDISATEYSVMLAPSNTDLEALTYSSILKINSGNATFTSDTSAVSSTAINYLSTYLHSNLEPARAYDGTYSALKYSPATFSFTTSAASGSAAICFLADAPVLTPSGYRAISSIKEGDLVSTAAGRTVAVKRVFRKEYVAGAAVNPFVIPKGSFGALRALPISPNHEVMTTRGMVQAKELGLPRMKMAGSFTYYNLELEDWVRDNLVVAGVECESLAPAARVSMTKAEFGKFVKARYGPAAAARLRTVCFEEKDGSVSMPAL